jgi:hypothetical protein
MRKLADSFGKNGKVQIAHFLEGGSKNLGNSNEK